MSETVNGYIDLVIKGILNREGGFVNKASDRGGATKYGITRATLARWRGKPVSVKDVENLTKEEAARIYKVEFIEKPGFLNFGDAMAEQLIDAGVHHGQGGAIKLLQKAVGVKADGGIGPITIAAANKLAYYQLFAAFFRERLSYYSRILKNDPTQLEYGAGWMNRAAKMIRIYCAAVNAPDAFEDDLEEIARYLNSQANLIGKRKDDPRCPGVFAKASDMLFAASSNSL